MAVEHTFFSEGILAGSLVATSDGWAEVESLAPGDSLLTFDAGPQRLAEVRHARMSMPATDWPIAHWPLQVPAQALSNRQALRILPGQLILIESDIAETMFGDPFALLPARALEPWRAIMPCPPHAGETAYFLAFEREQLVYVNGGALLHCPAQIEQDFMAEGQGSPYVPLSLASARELIAAIIAEEVGAALQRATPKGNQAALG